MNFVVAFPAEAQPIIEFYQLEKRNVPNALVFQKDQHALTLSGMGRDKAASATHHLAEYLGKRDLGWINLGIAGHGSLELGDAFLASKITDDANKEAYYPPQVYGHSLSISTLHTSTHPVTQYEQGEGYDMEAHAFYQAANTWSTRELIQVIKIVSDNPASPVEQVQPKKASRMIAAQMGKIDEIVRQMDATAKDLLPDPHLENFRKDILSLHSFSVTRTHQLKDLLRHAQALGVEMQQIKELVKNAANAKDSIAQLKALLVPHQKLK